MAPVRADGDRALRPLWVLHGGLRVPSDGADLIPSLPLFPPPGRAPPAPRYCSSTLLSPPLYLRPSDLWSMLGWLGQRWETEACL